MEQKKLREMWDEWWNECVLVYIHIWQGEISLFTNKHMHVFWLKVEKSETERDEETDVLRFFLGVLWIYK